METTNLQRVFAENLKRYRDLRGFSQTVLAEKAGISLNFLSMIEIGRKFPSPENIELLASALEVKTGLLFIDFQDPSLFDDPIVAKAVSREFSDRLAQSVRKATEEFFQKPSDKNPSGF